MEEDVRIPTELIVSACLRDCGARAIPAYVLHKGALAAGTIVVKIVLGQKTCRLLGQSRDIDGKLGWMGVFDEDVVSEEKADDYIRRARTRDPDVWVVEIEDSSGKNPFSASI